jgi:hypothetical protein
MYLAKERRSATVDDFWLSTAWDDSGKSTQAKQLEKQ